jgi:hypothetical protein
MPLSLVVGSSSFIWRVPSLISAPNEAGGVGKSALTVRFMRGEFVENYDPTIQGACTRSHHTCLPHLTPSLTEEYRRPIEVDGELTWVGIVFFLVPVEPSILPATRNIPSFIVVEFEFA